MNLRRRVAKATAVTAALLGFTTACTGSTPDRPVDRQPVASASTGSPAYDAEVNPDYISNPTKPCDALSAQQLNKLLKTSKHEAYGTGKMEELSSYALVTDMAYDPRECTYSNKYGTINVSTRLGLQSPCQNGRPCDLDIFDGERKRIIRNDYQAMARTVGDYNQPGQMITLAPNRDEAVIGAEFATLRFFDDSVDGTCMTCATSLAIDFLSSYTNKDGKNINYLVVVTGTNISVTQIQRLMKYVVRTEALYMPTGKK